MELLAGHIYYKSASKGGGIASVRRILTIDDNKVSYEPLHGPHYNLLKRKNREFICHTNPSSFKKWMSGEVPPGTDFKRLDGAKIFPTFVVKSVAGEPIFRCQNKRASWYLRKGYAYLDGENSIRLTTDETEKKLEAVHGPEYRSNPFFLAVKNNMCCVCGQDYNLTRHHVLPIRHKPKIPKFLSCKISNILFICDPCHKEYEKNSELEPVDFNLPPIKFVDKWNDHFIDVMKPKFLPAGWKIWAIDPHKNHKEC